MNTKTWLVYPAALAAIVVSALMATGSPQAHQTTGTPSAWKPNGSCVRTGDAAGVTVSAKTINAKITSMVRANDSDSDIESTLARDWCLTRISKAPALSLAATSSADVTWTLLTINYDNVTGWYYAYADWKWNNSHYSSEVSLGCQINGAADGKLDGVGIRLSGGQYEIKPDGYDATAWGNPSLDSYINDYGTWSMAQSTVSQYGVGFTGQDNVRKMENSSNACPGSYDITTWGGSIVLGFQRLNGSCANTQVFGDYVHTWSTTSVSSIGASITGFSIGWVSAGHSWPKQTAGGTAVTC
ncbi:MAG TPA: hypothetical protein VKB69_15500 [Micromonosporaceae bacterium]|nr:hypothetical protein [Micromonosporaceae bacterium]